ncbi:MAG TPA: Ig-like domain-containing protein, partial [Myxococcales bacterium]|nr:Ig-like domain-containing protein [Myxococcales bacterium]
MVETRSPQAPALSIAAPADQATITEGSIQLFFQAVAGDDTDVAAVDLYLEGQLALHLSRVEGAPIPVLADVLDEEDLPIPVDPAVRFAVRQLAPPFNDPGRLLMYQGLIRLPPGFVDLDPARNRTAIDLRAVATDREGHQAVLNRRLTIVEDTSVPIAEVVRPALGANLVESTLAQVEVVARDNVFVDRVEVLAGPSLGSLQVVHVAGGFPPENAVPGSAFDVYAPPVRLELAIPSLASLGGGDSQPYVIATRARDVSGNWSELFPQVVDVVRDREPAVAIISPADGATAVAGGPLPVVVAAEDDVGIQAVELSVNGASLPLVLRVPPFTFQVPVPTTGQELTLQAVGVDSFGHRVNSQLVRLSIVPDRPPTVAVAQPRQGQSLTEGRDFALVVAAQDDVGISWVEALVEGGVSGTLRYTATARPYSFRVPLPYGSAGRTLTFRARARDSVGHESLAAVVTVPVLADTAPPTVSFLTPAAGSQIVEGMSLPVEVRADDNVSVAGVTLKLNGALVATMPLAPYRFTYRVPKASAGTTLAFTAEAVDSSGNRGSASLSAGVVADEPPGVSLTGPAEMVAGLPAQLRALASDDVAVARVELHLGQGDEPPEVARRYVLPYDFSYIPAKELIGQELVVRARAVDLAGQATWSAPRLVMVVADRPPAVAIRKPLAGTVVFDGQRLRIEAEATDPDGGVVSVAFLVDGRRVDLALRRAGIPGAPNVYSGSFVAPIGSANRIFTITAVATDTAGQETVSAPVAVGTVRDTVAPQVELVDPPDRDLVTEGEVVTMATAAADNAGISIAEFWVDGVKIGGTSVPTPGPAGRPLYRLPWLVPSGRAGQLAALHTTASDPSNNVGQSQEVQVELGLRPAHLFRPFPLDSPSVTLSALASRTDGQTLVAGQGLGTVPTGHAASLIFATEGGLTGLGQVPLPGPAVGAVLLGNLGLVASRPTTAPDGTPVDPLLTILDLPNKRAWGSIDLPGDDVYGVAARDRLAFVANGTSGVAVIDIGVPSAPQRLATVPIAGEARGVFVLGDLLLVAGGPAGLRILDLTDPRLGELGFVAVPGGASSVSAVGEVAFVGCEGSGAQLAVIDVANPELPRLRALLPHAPARRDLLATGLQSVSAAGHLVLSAAQLTDQDAQPVKGMMSVNVVRPDGSARTLVRANLPATSGVTHAAGGALSVFGAAVAAFDLQRLLVTRVTPADGEPQTPIASPDNAVVVFFSTAVDPATVSGGGVVLRAGDPTIGVAVPITTQVDGKRLTVQPTAALSRNTRYYLSIAATVATPTGMPLGERFVSSFTTRASDGPVPQLSEVRPAFGPVEGGIQVTLFGSSFAAGARVYFSGAEASEVQVESGGARLTCRTPAQLEGPAKVTVVNPDGLEASLLGGFVYLPVLQLNFVVPATGSLAGGNDVDLSGGGFQRGAEVLVGDNAATNVRVLSPGRLRVTMPPGVFGPADVEVRNPDGRHVVAAGAYLYSDLVVSSIIGRHVPALDGPIRPAHRLPAGLPGRVLLDGNTAYVLSHAQVFTSARDAVELIERSIHGGLSLVDVELPTETSITGGVSMVPPYDPIDLSLRGSLAYVAAQGADLPLIDVAGEGVPSLLVVDVSDQVAPRVLTAVPGVGRARGLALAGDLALMASGPGGLALFSIGDPLHPVFLGAVTTFRFNGANATPSIDSVSVSGRYAVLTATWGFEQRLLVVDLGLPGLPVLGELSPGPLDVDVYGRRGLSIFSSGVQTLSLVPPARPHHVASVPALVAGTSFARGAISPQIAAAAGGS